ncbi:MAG: hypothetical protein KDE56_03245 [Anaerolineales bacterium]|nr:hypothetical protein [Anaerolineales bacterium]
MDLLLLVLGGILLYIASRQKDENGQLDKTGGALRFMGILAVIFGLVLFFVSFSAGFASAF